MELRLDGGTGGAPNLYPELSTLSDGTQHMSDDAIVSFGAPNVTYNPTADTTLGDQFPLLPGQLGMHPGRNREQSVVRWTAPATQTVTVAALFTGRDVAPTTTDVYVLHNGFSLGGGIINRFRVGPYFETTLEVQAGETIDFVVGDGGNGFTSDSSALDVVITSDSAPPPPPPPAPVVFQFATPQYDVVEGQPFVVLQVERTGGLGESVHVDFATLDGTAVAGSLRTPRALSDYLASSGTLFFHTGQNAAELKIPVRNDNRVEVDETFQVVLSDPSPGAELGALATATVVIHDNDPTVSFRVASSSTPEVAGWRFIEVRLAPASSRTVTVAYSVVGGTATPGADFVLRPGTLTFRPGETRKFIWVRIVHDTVYEGAETVLVGLSSPVNAFIEQANVYRLTIQDNDPQPPPQEPGSTPATAVFLDLQTLPQQSFRDVVIGGAIDDRDTFRVHLEAGEYLLLDADPEPVRVGAQVLFPGLISSTLVILGPDGAAELARVGGSREPETGVMTANPALAFRADTTGDYYVQPQTSLGTVQGYRLWFYRVGVSEKVPSPESLNVAGPMLAWFDGEDTVGITGPTGYGFTLEGPWQQQTATSRRTGLTSQVLTLPVGSQFTLRSPQGVELPLLANGPITISTKPFLWGSIVGVVTTPAVSFPVSLAIAPINDLLSEVFGSQMVAVGLLSGAWRISLGGNVLAADGRDTSSPIDPLLAGVPYLRQKGPIKVSAQLGSFQLDYSVIETPVDWAFDPADPMLFLRVEELGQVKQPGLAISMHGLLEYEPQDAPAPTVPAGVTQFFGHVFATATVPFKVGPLPLEVDAEAVINVDADRDGRPLGDLRDVDQLFDVLGGDFSEVREILNGIQFGANGKLNAVFGDFGFEMELGRASMVLNGLEETIWVRGQQGGTNPLAGTPLAKLNTASTIVLEGMIDWDGDFFLSTTTSYSLAGVNFVYSLTVSQAGIFAHVTGRAEWSASINYGAGKVSGKAIAQLQADVAIQIDDNGRIYLSGSASATGRLRYNGTTLFSGTIDASVRSHGFRFRFPRGVGTLDLDLF